MTKFRVSYTVTWTYPEVEIEEKESSNAINDYMKQVHDGKLSEGVSKKANWSVSGTNGNSH